MRASKWSTGYLVLTLENGQQRSLVFLSHQSSLIQMYNLFSCILACQWACACLVNQGFDFWFYFCDYEDNSFLLCFGILRWFFKLWYGVVGFGIKFARMLDILIWIWIRVSFMIWALFLCVCVSLFVHVNNLSLKPFDVLRLLWLSDLQCKMQFMFLHFHSRQLKWNKYLPWVKIYIFHSNS